MKFNLPAAAAIAALFFMSAAIAGQSEDESRPTAAMAMAELRGTAIDTRSLPEAGATAVQPASADAREPVRHVRIVGPLFFPDH